MKDLGRLIRKTSQSQFRSDYPKISKIKLLLKNQASKTTKIFNKKAIKISNKIVNRLFWKNPNQMLEILKHYFLQTKISLNLNFRFIPDQMT